MTLDNVIRDARRKLNIAQKRGILGTSDGVVRESGTGRYYVRIEKATGVYYPAAPYALSRGAIVDPRAGIPVWVGYDSIMRQDVITGMDTVALARLGINPLRSNPNDPAASDLIPEAKIGILYSRPHPDTTNYPFYAQVYPANLLSRDEVVTFAGTAIDLSNYQPDSGYHRYVIVFIKSDFATLEAFGSTQQLTGSALDDTDLTEAYIQRTTDSIAIRAFAMSGDDSSLNGKFLESPYLRQLISDRAIHEVQVGDSWFEASCKPGIVAAPGASDVQAGKFWAASGTWENPPSASGISSTLFDANTILKADTDDTPEALVINEQEVLGRATGGEIDGLAIDNDLSAVSANDDTVPSAKATKTALDGKAASSHNHAASDITSGTLAHERGGLEFDASAVDDGDLIVGTGSGSMGILAADDGSDGDVPTLQADGSIDWEAPSGGSEAPPKINLVPNGSFDVWENGVSAAPDAWSLTGSGASVARSTTTKVGLYSAAITRSGNDCHLSQDVYVAYGSTYVRSRSMIFGAWVYATVASRVRLRVYDGSTTTYSSYHTGGSSWEFLTVSVTVGAAITELNVGCQVDTGDTVGYFDGATLIEGSSLSYQAPGLIPFSDMPRRAEGFFDVVTVTAGNPILQNFDVSQIYQFLIFQSIAAADGDSFTLSFWLKAGSYTLTVLGYTGSNAGILEYYIDNVLQGSHDWYTAGATYNVKKTQSVTVIGDGYHILTCTINGKNASSSNYYYLLTKWWLKPASD